MPGGLWVSAALADPHGVAPGSQDETLTKLAWWAAGSLDRDIAEAVLWRWTECLTLGNPSNPWTIQHVRQKLDSAYAKRPPEFVVEGASSALRQSADPEAAVSAIEDLIVRASDYDVTEHEDWIVEHVAAPGCFTEVVGEVKKGKTTFNGQMVRCVLSGESFLGWRVRQTKVVLYTEQVGLSLEKTLERAGVRRSPDLYVLDQSQTFGRPWSQVACALLRKCRDVGAQLLFVDTLTRLAGISGESENQSGVVSVLDPFREAKAMGLAVVFVRHASKSRENREDASRAGRGSTAITGEMDIAVNLFQPGDEDVRRVRTISRLGEEVSVLLQYDGGGYKAVAEADFPVSTRARKDSEVRDQIETEFRAGNTTVAGIAKTTGRDRKTVRRHLQQMTGGFVVDGEESE